MGTHSPQSMRKAEEIIKQLGGVYRRLDKSAIIFGDATNLAVVEAIAYALDQAGREGSEFQSEIMRKWLLDGTLKWHIEILCRNCLKHFGMERHYCHICKKLGLKEKVKKKCFFGFHKWGKWVKSDSVEIGRDELKKCGRCWVEKRRVILFTKGSWRFPKVR